MRALLYYLFFADMLSPEDFDTIVFGTTMDVCQSNDSEEGLYGTETDVNSILFCFL